MNQQYMQQQQQQQQQPQGPPLYGGYPPAPYEGLNSNVPPAGPTKPAGMFPPQKTMQPPNMPPPTGQNYYNYNIQANTQGAPPPPINMSSNITNQMSNMTLNHPPPMQQQQQHTYSSSSNVNGYSKATDHSPVGPQDCQMPLPTPKGPPPPTNQSLPPGNNFNRYPSDLPPAGNNLPGQRPPTGPPPASGPMGQQPPPTGYGPPHQARGPGHPYPPPSQPLNQSVLSGPPLPSGTPPQEPQGPQPGPPGPYNVYQLQGQAMPPQMSGVTPQMPPGPPQMQNQQRPQMPPRPPAGLGYPQPTNYPPNYKNAQDPYAAQRGPYQGLSMPAPQGFQSAPQPQAKRLDPESMPSPIHVMQDDQKSRGGVFITNQKGLAPPFVTTKFVVQDQGNASPRFIRSTIYTVPTTTDIMKQTGVPFGLILSPMASIVEGEEPPPIIDMGEIGPVRCIRCKAYMSPYMQFVDAGRRFSCLFCKATTEVPAEYFQHLDHTGQRMDRYERPELMLGTYEFIATKDYCRNQTFPKPPAFIFVIDVSYNTIKSGLVRLLCAEMKNIIKNLPKDNYEERTKMKIGFITYSSSVHFYNISPSLTQPQMMVVGDVQDVFMPLLDGFLCDAEESEAVIDALMEQIPIMFADTRETETILAPAIQAGLEALKASECVGKLLVFHSSLPIAEAPGKLKNRDDRKLLGTEKEKTVLAPQNNVYNNLGQECVAAGCSVDLFVFNNSYVDIATIGQVCRLTGGEVYKYTYFQSDIDGERLIGDIVNNISRPIAFDSVMRVRTSTGVRPTDFYGHFYMSNTTDMELASIDCNKAVAIEIKHDDKLTDEEGVYIQVALLYTSCSGIRRLRIINLSLRTSSQMAELYRACDPDAVINFFAKQSVFKLIETSPKTVKDSLVSRCATILATYRKHCASPFSASQLVLPECMKLLPLYVNCLMKSDAISGGADMTVDDRSFVMLAVATMPLYTSVVFFYPKLIPLHDLDVDSNELPQQLRCSYDKFLVDGAYLLENGIHMFLWMGSALAPEWIQSVFGVPVPDTDRSSLPILDTPLNKRVRDVIERVSMEKYHCMRLTIVRQRDKLEMVLRHFLVEDRGSDSCPSYVDFLCHMHKEIKTLMSQ